MADAEEQSRPSFGNFRRQQDEGKPLVFVSQEPQSADAPSTQPTAQEKAQRRRIQVRRAQLQHRERKAGYVKKLELDVTQIRDATRKVERTCEALRRENEEMRLLLAGLGGASVLPSAVESRVPIHEMQLQYQTQYRELGLPCTDGNGPTHTRPANFSVDKTVTLSTDEVMQQPCYKITPSPPGTKVGSEQSSVDEEDLAINFILSLEHICWDHFHPSDFQVPPSDDPGPERGHALLASTFCAAAAPEALYPSQRRGDIPLDEPLSSWRAGGLTLQNLRLLASSLAPGDVEITPVQGWFELVERYGRGVLSGAVMDALKKEFVGVVKCLHFGAIIEREAFDSVVGRVMVEYADSLLGAVDGE